MALVCTGIAIFRVVNPVFSSRLHQGPPYSGVGSNLTSIFLLKKHSLVKMKNMSSKSLLVLGGNGFVGGAVCRAALRRGWQVSSLSRHGAPINPVGQVNWIKGSSLDADDLKAAIDKSRPTFIVHSIGTLYESPPDRTYESMNHKTLQTLLSGKPSVSAIGYVSAAWFDPLTNSILSGYYRSKREAEKDLIAWEANGHGRALVFRPGLVYGRDRWMTIPIAFMVRLMSFFTAGIFPPPIQVDRLAESILGSLESSQKGDNRHIYEPRDL